MKCTDGKCYKKFYNCGIAFEFKISTQLLSNKLQLLFHSFLPLNYNKQLLLNINI